jgi:photosynthetic reaction center cytochrome c subunit
VTLFHDKRLTLLAVVTLLTAVGLNVYPAALGQDGSVPPPQLSASPTPTPVALSDAAAENQEALERIKQFLAGRENEPAEKVFKNIELLRGKPAGRLPGMMSALTGLLGARCSTCHMPGNFASDELATKQTARRHFAMQAMLNRDYFADRNAITCLTCHHGHFQPPAN